MEAISVADFSVAKDRHVATEQKLGTAELLFRCAAEMGLQPSWVTPKGLFAVSVDGHERYVNFARSPLNSHASISLASDKYLTRLVLERNNIQNIPFIKAKTETEAITFLGVHGKIIAKPVDGSGARDVHIVTQPAQLQALNISGYILEKYIAGIEMRYLVLNDSVIGVYQSDYGVSVEATRALRCIASPTDEWNPLLITLAVQAMRTLHLKFAAVDFLIDAFGHPYILEVNTTPDLKWFHAPSSGPGINVVRPFLEAVFEDQKKIEPIRESQLPARPTLAYT